MGVQGGTTFRTRVSSGSALPAKNLSCSGLSESGSLTRVTGARGPASWAAGGTEASHTHGAASTECPEQRVLCGQSPQASLLR